ncbi:MAG TPA: hypothetical protein VND92_08885 [Vicinamibacterales bacterium]|nr:hypothetical protein [Vicinamibacterales bacterium]
MAETAATPHEPHARGRVVGVRGSVVDVEFPRGHLPALNEAIGLPRDGQPTLIMEVQQHLDAHTVRAVAMQSTSGVRRDVQVDATGAPMQVPVGRALLGRLVDVLGAPIDHGPAFGPDVPRWPIHRDPPPLPSEDSARTLFHTGIKVIDLLAPLLTALRAAAEAAQTAGPSPADNGGSG